jgi:tetratricopeptide (TPR) repeat protein
MKSQEKFQLVYDMNRYYKETSRYLERIRAIMADIKGDRLLTEGSLKKVSKLMDLAGKLYNEKKYKDALKYYTAILVLDKNNQAAKQKVKDTKIKLNLLKEKEKSEVKKKKSRKTEASLSTYYNKGLDLYDYKKYNEALTEYKKGKKLAIYRRVWREKFAKEIKKTKKKLAEQYYEQGYVHYQQNNLEKAVEKFKKAISYNSNFSEAKDKLKKVENKILQINKKKAERLYSQGMNAYTAGNTEKAFKLWEETLKYDSDHVQARNALERKEITLDKPEEVAPSSKKVEKKPITRPKKSVKTNTIKAEKLYEEGMDQYASGYLERAVELWEKALEYDEDHIEAKKALERVKARKGE